MLKKLLILSGLLTTPISACAATGDIEKMQTQAVKGDSEAALSLFHYFLTERNNPTEAAFWLRLGAEQGSCAAMIEYGRLVGGGMQDYAGRKAWFEKARERGCELVEVKAEKLAE